MSKDRDSIPGVVTAEQIARALHGRRSGRGWMALCPAHKDRRPSFSITERNGKVLVNCRSGCTQNSVIAALRSRGLWPERERRTWTLAERRDYVRYRADLRSATWWGRAATALAEEVLEALDAWHPEREQLTRLLAICRGGGPLLVSQYRSWTIAAPELTAAMVRAGRNADARLQRMLASCATELWEASNAV
jgi:hypothetical protein